MQNKKIDVADKKFGFQQGNKTIGRNQAPGVTLADQGLDPDKPPGIQTDLGLKLNQKLPLF